MKNKYAILEEFTERDKFTFPRFAFSKLGYIGGGSCTYEQGFEWT